MNEIKSEIRGTFEEKTLYENKKKALTEVQNDKKIVLVVTMNNTHYVGTVEIHKNFDRANNDRNVAIKKEGSGGFASIGIRRSVKFIYEIKTMSKLNCSFEGRDIPKVVSISNLRNKS